MVFIQLPHRSYVKGLLPVHLRVIWAYNVVNKSSEYDQDAQSKTDAEQTDNGEKFSSLQYSDGNFKIIFKHVMYC
jgi:hypothetical protein